MEKQKLFAISIITRGIYVGLLILEVVTGLYYEYWGGGGTKFGIFLRFIDSGTLIFMIIVTRKLLLLYDDRKFTVFQNLLLVVVVISLIANLTSVIVPLDQGLNGWGMDPFILQIHNVIKWIYLSLVWIGYFLFTIAWNYFFRYYHEYTKKSIPKLGRFLQTSFIINILGLPAFFIIDTLYSHDFFESFFVSISYSFAYSLADTVYTLGLIFMSVVLFLNSLAHIISGVKMYKNPMKESERILEMIGCKGCKNIIHKDEGHCPYCGFVYSEPKEEISL